MAAMIVSASDPDLASAAYQSCFCDLTERLDPEIGVTSRVAPELTSEYIFPMLVRGLWLLVVRFYCEIRQEVKCMFRFNLRLVDAILKIYPELVVCSVSIQQFSWNIA